MKTRKVGKLVSLILAIVLVATIMIPAVNVLADSAEKSPADYSGTWTAVSSAAELKDAVDAANAATDPEDKEIYLYLANDIILDTPEINDIGIYLYSMVRTKTQKNKGISERKKGLYTWDTGIITHTEEWLLGQDGGSLANTPYNSSDPSSPFYGVTADELRAGIRVTTENQELVGMGKLANKKLIGSEGPDEKIGHEFDEISITIENGTMVTLDLNGCKMSASDQNPYDGDPKYPMNCFNVKGVLNIVDRKDGTGQITGGSGVVIYNGVEDKIQKSRDEVERIALFDDNFKQIDLNTLPTIFGAPVYTSTGRYRVCFYSHSYWLTDVSETRGGGVYVSEGGTLNLYSGNITGNGSYIAGGSSNKAFSSSDDLYAKGGGVYVEAGAQFNMYGGEVSKNAARAYQPKGRANDAYAYGGGVYLEGTQGTVKGAVMTMTGGKIAENAVYAEASSNGTSAKSARAYGGGIYVGIGATCTIMGDDVEEGETDLEMVKSFPQVTNNSIGALAKYSNKSNPDITIQGGGIYNGGTLNLKNALITANDFAEGDVDIPGNKKSALGLNTATRVMRDPDTGLARYILEYNADGKAKTYVTRLDDRFSENLELATEKVPHATTGVYGTMHGNEEMVIFSDGAGVCVRENAKLVVGERVWITDNYDLVTTGHKAFTSVRDYTRTWEQEKQITDDRVMTTNDDGYGVSYTDPAGGYVYDGTYVAPNTSATMADGTTTYTSHVMDGYAFSDTTDDVYIPEGNVIYKGGSLFETKIGVNYWNMVNADGEVKPDGYGRAGNRVIVKAGKNLDPEIWGTDSSIPTQSDIQFFYLNDNNKNWERVGSRTRNANNDYYDYRKTDKNVPVYGYKLPSYLEPDYEVVGVGYPATLCDKNIDSAVDWASRVRITAIDADSTAVNRDASPYEGYINYDKTYAARRWQYGVSGLSGVLDESTEGYWKPYDKKTYRISDPDWSPDQSAYRPKTGGVLSNAIVNFPQRAYPVTSTMKSGLDNLANGGLPESYLKAKYMDYKVVYDNDQFGATEPVLRFGTYEDAQSNDTIRKMFVTVNFDEADIHFYGQSKNSSIVYNSGSAATSEQTYTFTTKNTAFANVDASALFYGANRVKGTIDIAKIVPNYESYGKGDILKDLRAAAYADAESSLSYDDADKKNESIDLYFKGWKYYTSYGDGPKVETLSNSVEESRIEGTSLSYRGYFPVNLENIFNPNINSQPCPSLTAIWYTKEELAAARQNLSACKAQLILGTDGHIYIRVISVLGAYGKDRNNLQPIQASDANSSLSSLYYNAPTFVASKLNATPTLEGGYKATVNKGNIAAGENFSARVVKKIICNDDEKNTFTIDIYDYISGKKNNEKDVWVKFINSNPEYKKANNSKSTTYVSFMWTNIDTGLTLDKISNADGSDYSDVAKEVWFVTPCIELTKDQAGYKHDSYYYGASRGFSIASLDTQDHNKLLEQAKTATN